MIIADDPEQFERYMNTGQSSAPTSIYKYKMSIVTINWSASIITNITYYTQIDDEIELVAEVVLVSSLLLTEYCSDDWTLWLSIGFFE